MLRAFEIDFAKDVDPTGERAMFSPARWVQELYPVDEMLAKKSECATRENHAERI